MHSGTLLPEGRRFGDVEPLEYMRQVTGPLPPLEPAYSAKQPKKWTTVVTTDCLGSYSASQPGL